MSSTISASLRVFVFVLAFLTGCEGSVGHRIFVKTNLHARRFVLANGLDVVLHPDPSAENVVVDVRYDVGSKDDPPGRTGLAHLLEHLTYRRKPGGALDAFAHLESAGSSAHNAETTPDYTEYHAVVPAAELPLALWLEAGRMAHPMENVDEAVFQAERGVVQSERREKYEDVPYGHLDATAIEALFGLGHPYSHPAIGSEEDLRRASREDAVRFAARHYHPNNATLVIAGAFDEARAAALVESYFEAIPTGPVPPPIDIPITPTRSIEIDLETGLDAPAVAVAWVLPPAGAKGWYEMLVAWSELGGYVYHRMRDLTRKVHVRLFPCKAASALIFHAELQPGASVAGVLSDLDVGLEHMEEGAQEIGDSKSRLIAARTLSLEDLTERASALEEMIAHHSDPNALQMELHAISDVRAPSYRSAVGTFLRGKRVVVTAKPTPGAPKAGRRVP